MNEHGKYALSVEEQRRAAQVERLSHLGAEGVVSLLGMLDEPSWAVRRSVIGALADAGDAAARALVDLLRTRRDDETRIAAMVDALVASSGDVEAVLQPLLEGEDPALLADAAQILGRRRSTEAAEILAELTTHPNDNVAVAAIEALGRIGGRAAVEALIGCVQSGNFFRTFPAIDVLGRSGDPRAVEPLAGLLDDPHYGLEAARALGRTGTRKAAVPLSELLTRPSGALGRVAAVALAELFDRHRAIYGSSDPVEVEVRRRGLDAAAVHRLTGALHQADTNERIALVRVLAAIGRPEAVPALDALLSSDPRVAAETAEALAQLGRSSESRLHQRLVEADSTRRLVLLPLITDSAGAAEVSACLTDGSADVRVAACEALARIGAAAWAQRLFPLLADADPRVSQAAEAAVQALGSDETEALAMTAARSPDARVRRAALRILGYFGFPRAFPVLRAAVDDPDPRVRDAAVQGLPFLDDPRGFDALLELSQADNPRVRASAVRALGHVAANTRVNARLLASLSDVDPWVRYYACKTLGGLGIEAAAASISQLLADEAGQVRVAAIEALSHLESDEARQAILAAARTDDADMRRAALVGLGIGKQPSSLPALLEAAASDDPATRLVAVSSLAWFDTPEVISALGRAAIDEDPSVRAAAIGFLAAQPREEATRILLELLDVEDLREAVVEALGVHSPGRVQALLRALEGADDDRASILVGLLARGGDDRAVDALLRASELGNSRARNAACAALAELDDARALDRVEQLAETDPDQAVRRVCASALGR